MAYVYRHIRLDNNEPFYIGIGEDPLNSKKEYIRAHQHKSRNSYWKNIVKNTKYKVDILLEDMTWDQACEKEIEFIKLYGRKDKGLGPLSNLTDGGDGLHNPSQETRDKKSKSMLCFHKNNPGFMKNIHSNRDMTYISRMVSEKRDHKAEGIKLSEMHKNDPSIGIRIGEKVRANKERGPKLSLSLRKPIIQYDLNGKFIKEWSSLKEAANVLGIVAGSICNCLKGKTKTCHKSLWKYKI